MRSFVLAILLGLIALSFVTAADPLPQDTWTKADVKQVKDDLAELKTAVERIEKTVAELRKPLPPVKVEEGVIAFHQDQKMEAWPWEKEKTPSEKWNAAFDHAIKERMSLVTWVGDATCAKCEGETKAYTIHLHLPSLDGNAKPRAHVSRYANGALYNEGDLTAPFDCEALKAKLFGTQRKAAASGCVCGESGCTQSLGCSCGSGACSCNGVRTALPAVPPAFVWDQPPAMLGAGSCASGSCGSAASYAPPSYSAPAYAAPRFQAFRGAAARGGSSGCASCGR